MRWPEGPPHLSLNPPFLFFFSFAFFVFYRKNLFSPLKRASLLIFECLPLFLLSLFWPPPFSLPLSLSVCLSVSVLSLSLSLSLSLFCSFLSSFLPVFLCLLSFGSFFVSFFSFFFAFVSWKNNMKLLNFKAFFHQSFLFFGFLSWFLFQIPFSCLCFFLISICVFFQHQCFCFQERQVKTTPILKKGGGVAT